MVAETFGPLDHERRETTRKGTKGVRSRSGPFRAFRSVSCLSWSKRSQRLLPKRWQNLVCEQLDVVGFRKVRKNELEKVESQVGQPQKVIA